KVTSSARRLRGKVSVKLPRASSPAANAPGPDDGSLSLVPRAYSSRAGHPSPSTSAEGIPLNTVESVPPGEPFASALARQAAGLSKPSSGWERTRVKLPPAPWAGHGWEVP